MTKNKIFLLRTGESFLNAFPCSLHLSERSTEVQGSFHRKYALSFKYLQKQVAFIFLFMLLSYSAFANNIQIPDGSVSLTGKTSTYTMVQFDLSWENSWRTATPNNWDAAWVFVKYKVRSLDGGDGLWRHASLNNSSVNVDAGSISYGLLTPGTAFHATTNPVLGAFLYRSAIGTGPISFAFAQLRWNYGENYKNATNKIEDNDYVEIKVFAIEMVYVPGGAPFNVGDGSSAGTLRQTGSNTSYQITTTGSAIKCEGIYPWYDDSQLRETGIYVDGDGGISKTSATNTEMNPDWPTGFNAFYLWLQNPVGFAN